jgi:hypothetical protein
MQQLYGRSSFGQRHMCRYVYSTIVRLYLILFKTWHKYLHAAMVF